MNEIMPVIESNPYPFLLSEGADFNSHISHGAYEKGKQAQRDADRKWAWGFLLAHKVYQRKYEGQLQIMFGFSPDELQALKEAIDV